LTSLAPPLASVIQVTERSSRVFADAARGFGDMPLATTFLEIATRRLQLAGALLATFRSEPLDPLGQAYQPGPWGASRDLDDGHRDLLAGLVRSEAAVLFRYSIALAHDLPERLVRILSEQFAEVGETHDHILAVRDR